MFAVQTHFLAVVLADVRVVPVEAGIREGDPIGERAADGHRGLRLVGSVVAVVETQPVPMHGGFQVALVDDIDLYFRSLLHAQRRTGDRAVVGEHSHFLLVRSSS